jgi:predicted nucleic acid-binding protein
MNAVDTNVLLYYLDDFEPLKQGKAQALLTALPADPEPTLFLWQAAAELVNQLRRWQY